MTDSLIIASTKRVRKLKKANHANYMALKITLTKSIKEQFIDEMLQEAREKAKLLELKNTILAQNHFINLIKKNIIVEFNDGKITQKFERLLDVFLSLPNTITFEEFLSPFKPTKKHLFAKKEKASILEDYLSIVFDKILFECDIKTLIELSLTQKPINNLIILAL